MMGNWLLRETCVRLACVRGILCFPAYYISRVVGARDSHAVSLQTTPHACKQRARVIERESRAVKSAKKMGQCETSVEKIHPLVIHGGGQWERGIWGNYEAC